MFIIFSTAKFCDILDIPKRKEVQIARDRAKEKRYGLKIYINGIPDVHLLSETEKNFFISQTEIIISEMFEKNEKRKKYRK